MNTQASYQPSTGKQIAFWLGTLSRIPDIDEIRNKWGCSRATAFRYRALAESCGHQPLPQRVRDAAQT